MPSTQPLRQPNSRLALVSASLQPQPFHPQTVSSPSWGDRPSISPLMQAMIESFIDGILILTLEGQLVSANSVAAALCDRLGSALSQGIPATIWQLCQAFLAVQSQYTMAEAEILLPPSLPLRVRVRSLALESTPTPTLMVILEDPERPAYKLALNEVDQYGLTPREADVWMLRRANYSYKRIAQELYITVNTVKKHLKSIYAKLNYL